MKVIQITGGLYFAGKIHTSFGVAQHSTAIYSARVEIAHKFSASNPDIVEETIAWIETMDGLQAVAVECRICCGHYVVVDSGQTLAKGGGL